MSSTAHRHKKIADFSSVPQLQPERYRKRKAKIVSYWSKTYRTTSYNQGWKIKQMIFVITFVRGNIAVL